MMKKKFKWVNEVLQIDKSNIVTNCADIEFFVPPFTPLAGNYQQPNRALINGIPLSPGNSMLDTSFGEEINCSTYKINFLDDGAVGGNYLIIKRKIYLND